MSEQLRFDGKVVIVTGAGNGLGRSHALMFGARGAKVVVNDLGGNISGGGKSSAAADKVVEEIKALGGEAVANYDSVEEGDKIVKTALDAFGTVDIVINNAGILRDVSFQKMSQDDWNLILRVHLNGTKSVTQAAWPIMRDKGYGRVIMTTSAAGIYGNFGQANYCAAKLGILGLAQCLAEEGRNKGILVNTIAPIAASRLTETVMPPEMLAKLKPEAVTPLVGWLCHESCTETKGLFEVGAGYFSKLRWERTKGFAFAAGRKFELEDLAAKWDKVTDFTGAEHPSTTGHTFDALMAALNSKKLGGNEFIDLDEAAAKEMVLESSYDERDLALYALGVGAARDPLDDKERTFVYELGKFQVLPTWGVMPQSNAMLAAAKEGKLTLPGMNFGMDRLLHGEQYTEIKRPLQKKAKLKHIFKLKTAYDKAPNAVVVFAISSVDESGEEIVYNEMTAFVKGAGGWGGDRGPSADINVPPVREPDAVIEEKTDPNQTLLYRLSGDWNPLHADPAFAKAFGYDKPILHGLCTFGHVGRHVVKGLLDNDPRKFKSIKVRFAGTVFPGETLVTKMWKESDTRVIVETRVKERDVVVIKNAAVELHAQIPEFKAKPKAAAATATAAPAQDERIVPEDVFAVISAYVAADPTLAEKTKTSFQFNIANPDSQWALDLKNGKGEARPGVIDKPDVTIDLEQEHLLTLVTASLAEVQKLYFGGQLKIGGNVMASNKLSVLQAIDKKQYEEARAKRLAAGGGAAAAAAPVAVQDERVLPEDVFGVIAAYIAANPTLAEKTKTSFQFSLSNPESQWVLDLKNGKGEARPGTIDKPDVTVELDQEHLLTCVTASIAEVQKLYFGGQLKIGGNVMASNKLSALQAIDKQQYEAAKAKRLGGSAAVAAPPAAATAKSSLFGNNAAQLASAPARTPKAAQGPAIFAALGERLAKDNKAGNVAQGQVLVFKLREPEASWVVDLSGKTAKVEAGENSKAAAVFGIADADLAALVKGEVQAEDLFQKGRLRVDGDVKLARELSFLNKLI